MLKLAFCIFLYYDLSYENRKLLDGKFRSYRAFVMRRSVK
jgi:hypothetical protein